MKRRDFIAVSASVPLGLMHSFQPQSFSQEVMKKRTIPCSGEKLPVIGVGTWQTFDVPRDKASLSPLVDVLHELLSKGGSVIDSSPMYGRSEQVVGDLIKGPLLKSFFLATKVWTNGKEEGIRQMNDSFTKIGTEKMDLMQVHNLTDWKTHLQTLREWKDSGKIRYIGITHYHEGAYRQVEETMKKEKPDFVQINYSLSSRSAEDRILPLATDNGIAVLINQPFNSGNLFSLVKGKPLPPFSKEFDCSSWGQFFLKFIISHPAVTCVIPGTAKGNHMIDNASAGFGNLPDEELRKKMISYVIG